MVTLNLAEINCIQNLDISSLKIIVEGMIKKGLKEEIIQLNNMF